MALIPSRVLPWWPHILFAILEPLALLGGAYQAATSPSAFLSRLLGPPAASTPLPPAVQTMLFQLSNLFVLLSLTLALIFVSFRSAGPSSASASPYHHRLIRIFLILLSLADAGHLYSTYAGLGPSPEKFWDVQAWNPMQWSEIGGTVFLLVNRLATAVGLFGAFVGATGAHVGRKRE